jgi:hypothetical protein
VTDKGRRRQTLDPAVADIMDSYQQRQAEASLPPAERRKKKREREKMQRERQKARARLARRVNWDLPPTLKHEIVALAETHRVPASQLAALLLHQGLLQLKAGEVELEGRKQSSASPRYDANLALPEWD